MVLSRDTRQHLLPFCVMDMFELHYSYELIKFIRKREWIVIVYAIADEGFKLYHIVNDSRDFVIIIYKCVHIILFSKYHTLTDISIVSGFVNSRENCKIIYLHIKILLKFEKSDL